jgi:hypothetical protein
MKRLPRFVVLTLALAAPARAADPLADAYQKLQTAAAQERNAEYCVASPDHGAEGMPDLWRFHCSAGSSFKLMSRWCWTEKCRAGFTADMKALLASNGFAYVTTFMFGSRPNQTRGYQVFRKPSTVDGASYCLLMRTKAYKAGGATHYRVDCADGAITEYSAVEPGGGSKEIEKYLGARGYGLEGDLGADDRGFGTVLFRKR